MNKINVGIIGRNFGLKVIYRGLKKNNFFKVIGISFKKKSLKNDIPKNLKIYRNWRDLVSDKKIKAITYI